MKRKRTGFTLIEMIITIVVMAFVMIMIGATLVPQLKKTAAPIYQGKLSALASALSDEILSRKFDQNSDDTGRFRCGDQFLVGDASASMSDAECSFPIDMGPDLVDGVLEVRSGVVNTYDDVDDYVGCWGSEDISTTVCTELYDSLLERADSTGYKVKTTPCTSGDCSGFYLGPLADVSGDNLTETDPTGTDQGVDYSLFTVAINVTYEQPSAIADEGAISYDPTGVVPARTNIKRIDMIIDIDIFGRYPFTFYRGNY